MRILRQCGTTSHFRSHFEVDEIYSLACPAASPVHYQFDPVQNTKTSVIGAINMLGTGEADRREDPPGRWRPTQCGPHRAPAAAGIFRTKVIDPAQPLPQSPVVTQRALTGAAIKM